MGRRIGYLAIHSEDSSGSVIIFKPRHVRSCQCSAQLWFDPARRYCMCIVIIHYSHVIRSKMASQITGISVVYSTVSSGVDQRKHQSSVSLACVRNSPMTGEFPTQRASDAQNVSISWRHHDTILTHQGIQYFTKYKLFPLRLWHMKTVTSRLAML